MMGLTLFAGTVGASYLGVRALFQRFIKKRLRALSGLADRLSQTAAQAAERSRPVDTGP